MAKKEDKKRSKSTRVKTVRRTRRGKRKGSKGGASDTRYYPKYGDKTDNLSRTLYDSIVKVKTPPPNNGAFGSLKVAK